MIATVSQPSRRWLLAAATTAVALTGSAPPAAPNPDAGLIALCAAFNALERKLQAAFEGLTTDAGWDLADEVADAIRAEQAPILDAITACRPSTSAGFAALAGSLALWDAELLEGDPRQGNTNERLSLVLFRGITGRAGA